MSHDSKLEHLHPVFRDKVVKLQELLSEENLPFRVFEGYRTPERQRYLYSKGRTRSGSVVTYANAWQSFHQYGVAADFVLYGDGNWSWDDRGEKKKLWDRLQELGEQVGLKHLDWEKPHLQLKDVALSDLRNGVYPPGGDLSWAENLTSAVYSWMGTPSAPSPPEDVMVERPSEALDVHAVMTMENTPPVGSEGWHSFFGGQEWRHDARGVYIRSHANGNEPLRTRGEPITCRKIMELCSEHIVAASLKYEVPIALIIMTIATETAFVRKYGFTGPLTFRWEPHVQVKDVSPPTRGDYSAGPMQTLATTARWVIRTQNLSYDPFEVAPSYNQRPEPPEHHPLYDYAVNIDIGTAEIFQRWSRSGDDPILVAAAFNAGGLYETSGNAWCLKCYGNHLDRAAEWYGDACTVIKELGL